MDQSDVSAVQRRAQFFTDAEEITKKLSARVYSWTHDIDRTEDLVQRALLKYLEEREAEGWQREIHNELAYITEIARNLRTDMWRVEGKAEWISFDGEPDDGLMRAVDQLLESFDVQKKIYLDELLKALPLKTIFGKLNPEKAQAFQLYYREDNSIEEIAETLNKDPLRIKHWIDGIEATIRARVKKLYGKTGLFKSDS